MPQRAPSHRPPEPTNSALTAVVKARPDELAVAGAAPAFAQPRHVGAPNIGNRARLHARIRDLLDRRWLTNNGPYVQEFERRVAGLIGVAHCVAMANGTLALELAVRALGLSGEVIVPSFTFAATVHALRWQGISPVFCDVEPRFHTIDSGRVEDLVTPRTSGILAVHLWGNSCDVRTLSAIARRRGLKLLFDGAHAFGSSHDGRMVGSGGDAEAFSFHATKVLNTFEGGAVVTNDAGLASQLRLLRNLGFAGLDHVVSVGTNAKMSEIAAAMGLTGLESLERFIHVNRRRYREYSRRLRTLPGLRLLPHAGGANHQYIVVEVDPGRSGISRDDLVRVLRAENVLARRYFTPGCHRMPPYRDLTPADNRSLPETERLAETILCLPTGTAVSNGDVAAICQIIRVAVEHAPVVSRLLAANGRPSP
jgi:dTDP-4-amino-4,6-dideoxygalactose transaminase